MFILLSSSFCNTIGESAIALVSPPYLHGGIGATRSNECIILGPLRIKNGRSMAFIDQEGLPCIGIPYLSCRVSAS